MPHVGSFLTDQPQNCWVRNMKNPGSEKQHPIMNPKLPRALVTGPSNLLFLSVNAGLPSHTQIAPQHGVAGIHLQGLTPERL